MYADAQKELTRRLSGIGLIPVLVIERVDDGLRLCELFQRHGLNAAEITFRTAAAPDVLAAAKQRFPDLLLGAGTILNVDDLRKAFDHGASFAVAPGFNPVVAETAAREGLAFSPGVATPSEIEQAYALGARLLKYFPAESLGGTKMLAAMAAPYRHLGLRYMPTGGVTAENAASYWTMPDVAAVGGTWLGKAPDIAAGAWDRIENDIAAAVLALRTARAVPS
jgi:2-dehydro-3-deoxyphosphogluconate aldolase/(4S)-4-hydroxy-2-oxoglutarate aldolase